MTAVPISTKAAAPAKACFRTEAVGILAIALLGIAGYFLFPEDLAFLTRLISIVMLVLSLDLVTGYCGIATLGHAALFGISAYTVGNLCLAGFTDPLLLVLAGAVSGAVAGLISGSLVSRFRELPQLVLSIALGQLVAALATKLSFLTGGSDGLAGFTPGPVLGIFDFDIFSRTAYVFSVILLAVLFALLLRFVRSPFGLLCRGIRDDHLRAQMIGAGVYAPLVFMYGVSGAAAGVGGALSAITTGVVGLDSVSFERSAAALVMLALGGAGNLWGALSGAILFLVFEHIVSTVSPFHWMMLVGILLVAIVIFAPRGLSHGAWLLWTKLRLRGEFR